MYSNSEKIEWTLIFVAEFGKKFGLTLKQSFNYLTRYKGIDFIDKHYDYVHTQSFQSMISGHMTVETVADIWFVRYIFNDTKHLSELFNLQSTK